MPVLMTKSNHMYIHCCVTYQEFLYQLSHIISNEPPRYVVCRLPIYLGPVVNPNQVLTMC